jgi:hypothetical protein
MISIECEPIRQASPNEIIFLLQPMQPFGKQPEQTATHGRNEQSAKRFFDDVHGMTKGFKTRPQGCGEVHPHICRGSERVPASQHKNHNRALFMCPSPKLKNDTDFKLTFKLMFLGAEQHDTRKASCGACGRVVRTTCQEDHQI